jgi:hypothetical protein
MVSDRDDDILDFYLEFNFLLALLRIKIQIYKFGN